MPYLDFLSKKENIQLERVLGIQSKIYSKDSRFDDNEVKYEYKDCIGNGQSRAVFPLNEKYVVKIAFCLEGKKGNKKEGSVYKKFSGSSLGSRLGRVYHVSNDGSFLIMERCVITIKQINAKEKVYGYGKINKIVSLFDKLFNEVYDIHHSNIMRNNDSKYILVDYAS